MRTKYLTLIMLSILLFSCSSDPCEETICGIGTCIEGTCECPNGYYGVSCENNYFGIYAASLMKSTSCPSEFPVSSTSMSPTIAGERICYPFMGGQQCFFYRIELNEDLSFRTVFNQIAVAPGGSESLVSSDFPSGRYIFNNDQIILTFENGASQTLNQDGNTISWSLSQASDGFQDCTLDVEYTKLNQ